VAVVSTRSSARPIRVSVSGAPAPEGIPALVTACQAAGWRVVVFSTPNGLRFIDPAELERLTGEPVRSEYRMPALATRSRHDSAASVSVALVPPPDRA
jgi:hypothetical protein